MDSSNLDQADKSSPETSSDSSVPPDSPDTSDIFGEPLVHPRVGAEYQVKIPPLLLKSELFHLMMNPADSEDDVDSSRSFLMGLPIPVMWVCNQANPVKDEKIEPNNNLHEISTNGPVELDPSQKKEPTFKVDARGQRSASNLYCIVPGLSTDSWSDFEADCFLLGLYIFGKNLLQVMRFMDSKEMGQILSFYYGQFYGSSGYHKWSECRKMRNRKCVPGHRFFTGYRQQELFSRLLPHLCEETRPKLLEASRAFAEGRTSLDEYVSTLKALVGIHALVEAVGIGKGKDDLTTFIVDTSKNTQMFTHRPEIPSGKACSSLTCAEIVKYLTGDFRLSKARSNDLFWEAVWPRLLARGWHSEQPRGDGYTTGLKNCLVFLMPGIKKFSRRKLSKGDHYFDSVSDVLAKVASEPELLELEADETRPSSSKQENGWAVKEVNSDDDDGDGHDLDQDPSDHERHCYLKPRVSTGLSNLTNFTVVDTSLANEDNPFKVRVLRSLPLEAKNPSKVSRCLKKTETELQGNAEILPNDVKGVLGGGDIGESQRMQGNNIDPPKMAVDANFTLDHKSRAIKHQFSRRVKHGLSSCSGQVTKSRRLASCVEADVTYVLSLPARAMSSKNAVASRTSQPHVVEVLPTNTPSVARTSKDKIFEENPNGNCVSSGFVQENEKVIDLNLPQFPAEPDMDDKIKVEEGESKDLVEKPKQKLEQVENNTNHQQSDADQKLHGGCDQQQQPRRQSTRNRPLTTKALEALEIGFLNPIRHSRKRSPSTTTTQDHKSKRSRQKPRGKSSMFPNVLGIQDGMCNAKLDMLENPSIPTKNDAASSELLGIPEASFRQSS